MKILVSSKSLADCLNKLDLEDEIIERIVPNADEITFITAYHSVKLLCGAITDFRPMIIQSGRRWDWIKKLVNVVDEQPIVVEINKERVNVIFQY
ncbi:MAG: hypothetical protein PHT07_21510 [Paludibacter sp.]|nr:hypothetical protein [Paludibacter sp.]